MQVARPGQGGAQDSLGLVVMLSAIEPRSLDGFDLQQHVLGFGRLRRSAGQRPTGPRLRPRGPSRIEMARACNIILRAASAANSGVCGKSSCSWFSTSSARPAIEQDFAAKQAKLPLIDQIVT